MRPGGSNEQDDKLPGTVGAGAHNIFDMSLQLFIRHLPFVNQ